MSELNCLSKRTVILVPKQMHDRYSEHSQTSSMGSTTGNIKTNRIRQPTPKHRGWWLGGAMVLVNLPVLGRPSNLADSRARAYCTCNGCGCLNIFTLIYLFSPLSPSLWETVRYRLKYCLERPLNPKQTTDQPTSPKHRVSCTAFSVQETQKQASKRQATP